MPKYYPQEYLDAAEDQGERDFWDGVDDPSDLYPRKERKAWYLGWNRAHEEQQKLAKGDK